MVDRLKDNEDRQLESLFRSDPVPDAGFSRKVMSRIRRRIWIRRLALPTAFVIGAAIALKPLSQLVVAFSQLLTLIPADFGGLSLDIIPQASTILLGAMLLAAMSMVTKMLAD
ncbi:MAG: hypothetical protein ACE5FV_10745 [Woeseia sp.]